MSLLQNEDFTIWQLRTSYLSNIKDGIGDRLINVNNSLLNIPGFRAAGWSPALLQGAGHEGSQIKRTYSPPIPTTATVASEYYRFARHAAGGDGDNDGVGAAEDGEEDEGGMVTGGGGGTFAFGNRKRGAKKNRRRGRQQNDSERREAEDDDSSDLSDESEEEEDMRREAQSIKFTKVPVRTRAGSSPIRSSRDRGGPEVTVTTPSVDQQYRRSSVGVLERSTSQRPRGDTLTSSDMSENENARAFRKRQIQFSNEHQVIEEPHDLEDAADINEPGELNPTEENDQDQDQDQDGDFAPESPDSVLSSDFGATAGSTSLLAEVDMNGTLDSSPVVTHKLPNAGGSHQASPKKPKTATPALQDLPPPRPISSVQPISLLTKELKAQNKVLSHPLEKFAPLWAGDSDMALQIKIYVPWSEKPDEPFDLPMFREFKDDDRLTLATVSEAIGLSLWRYMKLERKPAIEPSKNTVNHWTLRMVDDGEVEYDFPPLGRNLPLVDFTSNNNRAAAVRGRFRGKKYDEFALIPATQAEYEENARLYPKYNLESANESSAGGGQQQQQQQQQQQTKPAPSRVYPILQQPFSSALNDASLTPADRPAVPANHATPRVGVSKTLKVRFVSPDGASQTTTVNTATDTYIAEILDSVCKRWGLDKGQYILKVMGSNTIAPLDRTVEALGSVSDLEVIRRRFGAGVLAVTGSPGSASPNTPLEIDQSNQGSSKKGKKGQRMLHPLAQTQKMDFLGGYYRRYYVYRKQSMSFTTSNPKVLVLDNDYLHIMPGDSGKGMFDSSGKTRSISFNDIIGSKVSRRHPKTFRVVVLRGSEASEQKRYDFEARNEAEAAEIVEEIKKNMEHYRV